MVAGSTAIIQIISILAVPILTRIFSPESFGNLATVMSTAYIFSGIASFRYDQAIMLPQKENDSFRLFLVSIFLATFFSFLVFLVFYFFKGSDFLLKIYGDAVGYFLLVPILIISIRFNESYKTLYNRLALFKENSVFNVIGSLFNRTSTISLGLFGYNSAVTLIVCFIATEVLGLFLKLNKTWKQLLSIIRKKNGPNSYSVLLRKYRNFPLFDIWSTLLNTMSAQLIPLILAFFLTAEIVGQYSQSLRMIQMPLILISGSIAQVFFQTASKIFNEGKKLNTIFGQTFSILFLAGFFPALVLLIAGDLILPVILGSEWKEAGLIAQILMPWVFLKYLGSPLSTVFLIRNQQNVLLNFNIISFAIRVVGLIFILKYINIGYLQALTFFSIAGFFLWLFLMSKMFKSVKFDYNLFLDFNKSNLLISSLLAIGILILKLNSQNQNMLLVEVLIIGVAYYIWFIFVSKNGKLILNKVLKKK